MICTIDAARFYVKRSICWSQTTGFPRFHTKLQCNSYTTLSLTVDICGKIPKYDAVWLIKHSAKDPIQPVVIVYEDALFGHPIRHHPDAQQKHEEEHVGHLEHRNMRTFELNTFLVVENIFL